MKSEFGLFRPWQAITYPYGRIYYHYGCLECPKKWPAGSHPPILTNWTSVVRKWLTNQKPTYMVSQKKLCDFFARIVSRASHDQILPETYIHTVSNRAVYILYSYAKEVKCVSGVHKLNIQCVREILTGRLHPQMQEFVHARYMRISRLRCLR